MGRFSVDALHYSGALIHDQYAEEPYVKVVDKG